jgi:hypothetical protein
MMLAAKIYLTVVALWGVLLAPLSMYTCFGLTRPNSKGPPGVGEWSLAIGIGLGMLVLHAGFIAAPLALGGTWHRTALYWMLPGAGIAALILLADCRWLILGLFYEKPGGAPSLARGGTGLVIVGGLYLLPAVVMWLTRP